MARNRGFPERDIILDSITEGVFTVDLQWRITSFNRAAERLTGIPRQRALGQRCKDIFRADVCEGRCSLEQTLRTGRPLVGRSITILDADGNRRPVSISTAILRDEHGEIVGGVETFRDLAMIEELRKEIERRYSFEDLVGRSHPMQELFELLPEVADSPSTVLVEGESGSGKELVARALHNLSPRSEGPFVALNCGALPDTLLESELFGYKAGAFTDARKDKPGRIAQADGGTLMLDEVGDLSAAMQVRLLRFLQERTYEPLGSVESESADVRVVAATNKDLDRLVEEGTFRQDVYYRINVVRLRIPPLRERLEDVPLLVEHFIARLNRLQGREVPGITDEAMARLMSHDYPGNVRELENIIERAFVLCRGGLIGTEHLPEALREKSPVEPSDGATLRQLEAGFIMSALRRNGWNRAATARQLGMHKTTLYRKIKSLGLQPPRAGKDEGPKRDSRQ